MTDEHGYGISKHTDGGKFKRAHRVAWEMTFGDIPQGIFVLHSCDNRACVNVFRHLRLGTQRDNMQECGAKGRMPGSKKANNPPQKHATRKKYVRRVGLPSWQERFWEKVDQSAGDDSCWLWTGTIVDGYGALSVRGKNKKAHRLSYAMSHEEPSPEIQVMHTCDQRACVNPRHLVLGTKEINFADMIHKNRHAHVLHPEDVRTIRIARGAIPAKELAKQYGVTRAAISSIWNGRTWRHLT